MQVVDWLWQYAFDQRASDIHLEPRREMGAIRFRIDGVLHTVYQVPLGVMNAMVSRIKLLGRMDVVERRRPLDGRIKTKRPDTVDKIGAEVEMRLSTLPTAFGEKLVMRIFDPETAVKRIEALGFGAHDTQRWQELIAKPHGIILVTGPTGSGKTTTLYSTLKQLATDEVNVCTIEDPIEMIEPAFNQTQVHAAIDMGFAEGLRALMRQDPDIIMVGEIRDLATAEMAIQAALTGHLVFSTLHTNDSASAITRLADLGVPAYLISATVIGVLAQRLTRMLCPACKQRDDTTTRDTLDELAKPWRLSGGVRPYKPVGCLECRHTGYRGRVGLYELLVMTDAPIVSCSPLVAPRPPGPGPPANSIACAPNVKPIKVASAGTVPVNDVAPALLVVNAARIENPASTLSEQPPPIGVGATMGQATISQPKTFAGAPDSDNVAGSPIKSGVAPRSPLTPQPVPGTTTAASPSPAWPRSGASIRAWAATSTWATSPAT